MRGGGKKLYPYRSRSEKGASDDRGLLCHQETRADFDVASIAHNLDKKREREKRKDKVCEQKFRPR